MFLFVYCSTLLRFFLWRGFGSSRGRAFHILWSYIHLSEVVGNIIAEEVVVAVLEVDQAHIVGIVGHNVAWQRKRTTIHIRAENVLLAYPLTLPHNLSSLAPSFIDTRVRAASLEKVIWVRGGSFPFCQKIRQELSAANHWLDSIAKAQPSSLSATYPNVSKCRALATYRLASHCGRSRRGW